MAYIGFDEGTGSKIAAQKYTQGEDDILLECVAPGVGLGMSHIASPFSVTAGSTGVIPAIMNIEGMPYIGLQYLGDDSSPSVTIRVILLDKYGTTLFVSDDQAFYATGITDENSKMLMTSIVVSNIIGAKYLSVIVTLPPVGLGSVAAPTGTGTIYGSGQAREGADVLIEQPTVAYTGESADEVVGDEFDFYAEFYGDNTIKLEEGTKSFAGISTLIYNWNNDSGRSIYKIKINTEIFNGGETRVYGTGTTYVYPCTPEFPVEINVNTPLELDLREFNMILPDGSVWSKIDSITMYGTGEITYFLENISYW